VNIRADRPDSAARWPLYLGLVALVILGLVAAGLWVERTAPSASSAHPASPAAATRVLVNPEDIPAKYLPGKAPTKAVADAIEAVAGDRTAYSNFEAPGFVSKGHVELIELPFAKVLVTEEYSDEQCHYCTGSLGVYYLKEIGGKLTVTGRWPDAVPGWDWGEPPEKWRVTNRFTSFPAIVAWGDFMNYGIVLRSSTLTELRPEGPVFSDVIDTGFDDSGLQEDPRRVCSVTGTIVNVRKDVGFDVQLTGTARRIERYRKRGNRFVNLSPTDWQEPCRS
jgi:hypothetical protein